MRRTLSTALTALTLAASGAATATVTAAPAYADAKCTGNVSVYGVLADGRLTYSVIDPDNGNLTHVVVSASTLGFTPKAMATLNFNTILITDTGGGLHRVDVTTNNESLAFNPPARIEGGWTHDHLAYDGHGHLYGTAGGDLLQYVVSRDKPGADQIGQRKVIGDVGFYLRTMAAAADDRLIATNGDGELISYAITGTTYARQPLDDGGWGTFTSLVSPGGGLYYGKDAGGAMYWYEDGDPADGSGADIGYHLNDPVSSRGWTQTLLSAQPATCTVVAPANTLRAKIASTVSGQVGTPESQCNRYHSSCHDGEPDWCAMFATWAWATAGVPGVPRGEWVARGLGAWGQDRGLFRPRSGASKGSPKVGDWAIYGPPDGQTGGHVDVITSVRPDGTLVVVGGNVSNKVSRRTIDPDTARMGRDEVLISGYVSPPGA
ncbi:CHAP domain-containing protein [Symbioplanes lichenis]|uniref:CHAP domain-containing protein n=1 Tax=Symbioplanes lichenis TaxID=1629072 RepID=UPI0027398FF8|nr:CHAP domain-containing protein [Actinoplanes lichenis]